MTPFSWGTAYVVCGLILEHFDAPRFIFMFFGLVFGLLLAVALND